MSTHGDTRVSLLWLADALIPKKYQCRSEVAEICVQGSRPILGQTLLKGAKLALSALDTNQYKGTKLARRFGRALQDVDAAVLAASEFEKTVSDHPVIIYVELLYDPRYNLVHKTVESTNVKKLNIKMSKIRDAIQ